FLAGTGAAPRRCEPFAFEVEAAARGCGEWHCRNRGVRGGEELRRQQQGGGTAAGGVGTGDTRTACREGAGRAAKGRAAKARRDGGGKRRGHSPRRARSRVRRS